MSKFTLLSFCLVILSLSLSAQTGEISGRITDESGEGVAFANVSAEQNGQVVSFAVTDFDGYYTIKPLNPGKYNVRATEVTMQTKIVTDVTVNSDKIRELDIKMNTASTELDAVEIVDYKIKLVDKEDIATKQTIGSEEIQKLSTRNIGAIASTTAAVYQEDEGSAISVKGARTDGTEYYIDGVRVRGNVNLPANAIEELTVITGGVPAKYGDATGGIITITTRGPATKYSGGIELITSQYLDDFGYNLANANLTGPIISKPLKDSNGQVVLDEYNKPRKKTIVGFFVAGEYLYQKDPNPSAIGINQVKDEVLEDLEENPIVAAENSDAFILAAETLTNDDIENQDFRPDSRSHNVTGSAKIDIRPADNFDVSIGGTANYRNYRDDFGGYYRYSLLNSQNNPQFRDLTWRVFARFTQRFGKKTTLPVAGDGTDNSEKKSIFQNAFYSLQFDYTRVYDRQNDIDHGTNYFDYGYVGNFDLFKAPLYTFGEDAVSGKEGWLLSGLQDTLVTFQRSELNPLSANYTSQYYELAGDNKDLYYTTLDQIVLNNGLRNGDQPRIPHGIWYGTGYQNDLVRVDNNQQFRLTVNGSVDIVPSKGGAGNKHAIEFGVEFEQRIDRFHAVIPVGLWTLMRQLANQHIDQLDTDNPILLIEGQQYAFNDPNAPAFDVNDTILYNRLYVEEQQSFFDKSLRERLGLPVTGTEFINTDALDPDDLSLNMFSADELFNNGSQYIGYAGYSYTGELKKSATSFNDFFTARDENGNLTRPIDAFRPIYTAFYLQDKFLFKDILFNIGVRIDRYDANQKVLRDRFLLYQAYTAGEARENLANDIPSNIGDDYVVYVDDFNSTSPNALGYRNGSIWYNAEGVEVTDPSIIARSSGSGRITPYLVNPDDDIKATDGSYDPNSSFEDYKPQLNVMPRLAFSFNLTDNASFFAHFDILTQRPPSNLFVTPYTWLFFEDNVAADINNPNLKNERTIDYQVGFKNLVTQNSAITISAFYRDMKDMIAATRVAYAYPRDYVTYDNIDFGTVKGLSVAYDLRKTRASNFSMRLNYTLQFAEGTGSGATSQLDLINAGQPNLRNILPLNFDSRHQVVLTGDYRFGRGDSYNGPVNKKNQRQMLADFGINVIARARSGEPYTAYRNATPVALFTVPQRPILDGQVNGSRLPWNFRFDVRLDKSFDINKKLKDEEGMQGKKSFMSINVYLLIQNLLNTQNIINVYSFTGNADDDGYLDSAVGQQNIESQLNGDSFQNLYRAYINNPDNYSLPRQIRLGLQLNF